MVIILAFTIAAVFAPCFFIKDYILYAFVMFYPIMPEYFALDLGSSIPLLTMSRILIGILTVYAFVTKQLSSKIRIRLSGAEGKLTRYLILFFMVEVLVALPHFSASDSLKEMILSLLEKGWVLYLLNQLINTEKKLHNCVKYMTIASVIVCLGGLMETVTGSNPFYMLATASRELTMANYTRLGVTRAEATLGHPISFSVYLLLIIPFVMYYCDKKNNKKMWVLLLLTVVALFATISRASILVFLVMFLWMMKEKRAKIRARYRSMLLLLGYAAVVAVILAPNILELVGQILMSLMNVLGASFELDSFGRNATGVASRLWQVQLVTYTLETFPLFGGGANYIYNHDVLISNGSRYVVATSIDNEYLLTLIDKGLLGLIAKLVLYIGLLVMAWKHRSRDQLGQAFAYAFGMYFISIIAVCELTSAKMLWIVIALFMVYLRENRIAQTNLKVQENEKKQK